MKLGGVVSDDSVAYNSVKVKLHLNLSYRLRDGIFCVDSRDNNLRTRTLKSVVKLIINVVPKC